MASNQTDTVQSRSKAPTMRVFAYRSGHLIFVEGPMAEGVASAAGALIVAVGPADIVGPTVRGLARLAYDNETYLVPGCPEAEGDDEAYKAFAAWFDRVQAALADKGVHLKPVSRRRARA
jgi:hypothetical protein